MIDTHAHLDFPEFDQDREEVISRAFDNGVKNIINVGVDLERGRKSIEIAEKHEDIFAAVGLHPEYFTKHITRNTKHNWIDKLKKLAECNKVVAIGETGLDYYHVTRNMKHKTRELEGIKKSQRAGFIAQIEIAKELGLPVIVHCRNSADGADNGGSLGWNSAWEDLYEIIISVSPKVRIANQGSTFPSALSADSSRLNLSVIPSLSKVRPFPSPTIRRGIPQGQTFFVLHCYSGGKKDTEKFLELPNVYFSFSGNITYLKPVERAEKLTEAVRMIPLERMMLDSDAPYLAPQDFRGKRNEPSYVKFIAEKIAEVKKISVEEAEKVTDENAIEFFSLPC